MLSKDGFDNGAISEGYTRHAVFIDDGEIVDPTLYATFAHESPERIETLCNEEKAYIIFKEYTPSDYLDKVLNVHEDSGSVTTCLTGKIEEEHAFLNEFKEMNVIIF